MLKKNIFLYWLIQLTSWGIFIAMIGVAAILQNEFTERTIYQLLELYFLLVLASHSIRVVFIKMDWLNFKLGKLIPRAVVLVLILSILILFIYTTINRLSYQEQWESILSLMLNILLYSIFLSMWTAVYLAYHLMRKSRLQEIDNLKLQSLQVKNELKTLRDQLNPHFLFNSLNNIRALIELNPEIAKSAITTLSNLLRNSLLLSKKAFISLEDELKLVDEYLQLEKIRYEERLNYYIDIEGDRLNIYQIQIPPFLIQSMVENAIKHGISKSSQRGQVAVSIEKRDGKLLIKVKNSGKYQSHKNQGIGIENTQRRLTLIYGNDAGFSIQNEGGLVISQIWINAQYLIPKTT